MKTMTMLSLLLISFLPDVVFAQNSIKLKGKVKRSKYYVFGPGSPHIWQHKIESAYDLMGHETESSFWSKSNKLDTLIAQTTTYYDSSGRRVKTVWKKIPPDTSKTTYTHNKQGNLIQTYWSSAGKGETSRIVFDKKNKADTLYQNGSLKPSKITVHLNGFKDEETSYYRDYGQITEVEPSVRPDTFAVAHKSIITFDRNRNKIDEKRYDTKGALQHHLIFKYDRYGNCIKVLDSVWRKDEVSPEYKRKLEGVYIQKYAYKKFDRAGNWLQQYTLLDGKLLLSARRELEYYN